MPESQGDSGFRVTGAVLLSAGIVIGVLIGVVAMLLARARVEPGNSASIASTATPARWFIWSGNEPLLGDPFSTEKECEASRKTVVTDAETAARRQLQSLPPMSTDQIQALGGNPADAILAGLDRVRRAYCQARP